MKSSICFIAAEQTIQIIPGVVWPTNQPYQVILLLSKIGLSIDPSVFGWKLTADWQSNFTHRAKLLGMVDVYVKLRQIRLDGACSVFVDFL